MKAILIRFAALAAALLLVGCAGDATDETAETDERPLREIRYEPYEKLPGEDAEAYERRRVAALSDPDEEGPSPDPWGPSPDPWTGSSSPREDSADGSSGADKDKE